MSKRIRISVTLYGDKEIDGTVAWGADSIELPVPDSFSGHQIADTVSGTVYPLVISALEDLKASIIKQKQGKE